jgi:hypothetical protein
LTGVASPLGTVLNVEQAKNILIMQLAKALQVNGLSYECLASTQHLL